MMEVVEIEEVSLGEYLEVKEIMLREVNTEKVSRVCENSRAKKEEFKEWKKGKVSGKDLAPCFARQRKRSGMTKKVDCG